jgi:hypothetical protein
MQNKKKPRGSSFPIGHKTNRIYNEPLECSARVRLTRGDYEKLVKHCDRHDLKVSAVLRELVEEFLETVPDQ